MIAVADQGVPQLSSTCQVTVTIISANEFAPVTTVPNFSMTLSECASIGSVVYDVVATDSDNGIGSAVTYTFTSGSTNSDFFLYVDTGSVIVWNNLDFDTMPQVRAAT